eukprot:9589181-Ditylum_brightwellii.AAC.1
MKEKHSVTYDSKHSDSFMIEGSNGLVRNFKQSERGLYYTVMDNEGYILLNPVADNKTKYSPCDYSCAVSTRKLQAVIGHPSLKTFLNIVDNDLLPNYPITRADVIAAKHIFGP